MTTSTHAGEADARNVCWKCFGAGRLIEPFGESPECEYYRCEKCGNLWAHTNVGSKGATIGPDNSTR